MFRRPLRLTLALVVLSAVLVFRPSPLLACTCGLQYGPYGAFDEADAVFVGTVTSITDLTGVWNFDQLGPIAPRLYPLLYRRATLTVSQAWKGVTTNVVTVRNCGYPFAVGKQYLVYAYQARYGLETDVCTRTDEVVLAAEDLAYLQTRPSLPLRPPLNWLLVCAAALLPLAGAPLLFFALRWRMRRARA